MWQMTSSSLRVVAALSLPMMNKIQPKPDFLHGHLLSRKQDYTHDIMIGSV
jgi:hypothetical protein